MVLLGEDLGRDWGIARPGLVRILKVHRRSLFNWMIMIIEDL
jgi:hypothetical protein